MKKSFIINWERISKAIYQSFKKEVSLEEINQKVIPILVNICDFCGEYTTHRSMLIKIGNFLLNGYKKIIIPICPDYSHNGVHYTMKSVSDGIPLSVHKHFLFLKKLSSFVKDIEPTFILADQEIYDVLLSNKMNLTQEQFLEKIIGSKKSISSFISNESSAWKVELMSSLFPAISEMEKKYITMLDSNEDFRSQIRYDTTKRSSLYNKIDPNLSIEEQCRRTIRTAAQYYSIGQFCFINNYLICNHTTTNLSWYQRSGVGIIHNPITIY